MTYICRRCKRMSEVRKWKSRNTKNENKRHKIFDMVLHMNLDYVGCKKERKKTNKKPTNKKETQTKTMKKRSTIKTMIKSVIHLLFSFQRGYIL